MQEITLKAPDGSEEQVKGEFLALGFSLTSEIVSEALLTYIHERLGIKKSVLMGIRFDGTSDDYEADEEDNIKASSGELVLNLFIPLDIEPQDAKP